MPWFFGDSSLHLAAVPKEQGPLHERLVFKPNERGDVYAAKAKVGKLEHRFTVECVNEQGRKLPRKILGKTYNMSWGLPPDYSWLVTYSSGAYKAKFHINRHGNEIAAIQAAKAFAKTLSEELIAPLPQNWVFKDGAVPEWSIVTNYGQYKTVTWATQPKKYGWNLYFFHNQQVDDTKQFSKPSEVMDDVLRFHKEQVMKGVRQGAVDWRPEQVMPEDYSAI